MLVAAKSLPVSEQHDRRGPAGYLALLRHSTVEPADCTAAGLVRGIASAHGEPTAADLVELYLVFAILDELAVGGHRKQARRNGRAAAALADLWLVRSAGPGRLS